MIKDLSFNEIEKARADKKPLEGFIEKVNKDLNMIVSLAKDIEGVIPFNELYDQNKSVPYLRIGTSIKFYVKDISQRPGKCPLLILSPKEYASDLKQDIYNKFNNGEEVAVSGLVTNINENGNSAFIDIGGGLIGRLYISEVCKVRLKRIDEKIENNTIVNAIVKGFDYEQRIQLSTKKTYGTFQENISKLNLVEGTTCRGIVRGNDPNGNGVFVELLPNLVGLADFPSKFSISYGDYINVYVKRIEPDIEGVSLEIIGKSNPIPIPIPEPDPMIIRVPNVIGLNYSEALTILRNNGCYITTREEEYSEINMEKVIRTDPEIDSIIGEYDTVRVVVSKGIAKKSNIPQVIGMNIDKVESMLNEIGIKYEVRKDFNDHYENNIVYQVVTDKDASIKTNSEGTLLLVSKGKSIKSEYERSPFASRKNEIKVKEESRYYRDINTLMQLYECNNIKEIDLDIIEIISRHKFIISNQITNILNTKFNYDTTQDRIRRRLERLMNLGILARYYFESDEGKGIFRAYCLRYSGSVFLFKLRQVLYRRSYRHEDVEPYKVKSYLAANQVVVSYLLNPCMGEMQVYEFDKKLCYRVVSRDFAIKSHLNVVFKQDNECINCNFEILRRTEKWDFSKWVEKFTRYQAYYETLARDEKTKYNLIILCEDEAHIFEIYENMEKMGIYFKGVELLYSCDLRHNPNKLSHLPSALVRLSYQDTIKEHILL